MADEKKSKVEFEEIQPDWDAVILVPEPLACPSCGSTDFREVIYGLPAEPLSEWEEGYYKLGGCVTRDEQWWCSECGHEW